MMDVQPMKRGLTDFFSSYRKRFVVALLAVNLSGCVCLGGPGGVACAGPDEVVPLVVGVILASPVLIPMFIFEEIKESPERKKREIERKEWKQVKALFPKVHDYLKTACEKDERLFVKSGIALNEGILVLNNRGNAPLPLLESAPKEVYFKEIQYGYAIPWDDDNSLEKTWYWYLNHLPSATFFIEDGKGKTFQRASKQFWEQAGLRERVLNDSPQIKTQRNNRWSEAGILKEYERATWKAYDLPVDAPPNTRYALSIEDISTLEDRAHWVARGKIALIERATGETVAEYVGFQANTDPWIQENRPSRHWYFNHYTYKLCPSADSYSKGFAPDRGMVLTFLDTVQKGARKTVPDFYELLTGEKR